jgi:hypothetical protein
MPYWRMQLHPNERGAAARHAIESLSAGFIGLDFERDLGDLSLAQASALPDGQKDYIQFARDMKKDDLVLIIVHHFPFALAIIDGEYNYIKNPEPKIGVWFRHFRRVREVKYYSDATTNAAAWQQLRMTDTISPLYDPNSKSYRLIESWQ